MAKIVTSPVKRFAGTITLPDGFTYPQVIAFDRALADANAPGRTPTEQWHAMLRGLIACVETWSLAGVPERPTPETFPATPRVSAQRLVGWLLDEIQKAQLDEGEPPNA